MLNCMENAPRDRLVTLLARQVMRGVGPIDKPFYVAARFDADMNVWVADDNPQNGLPGLGPQPLAPIGWVC
jgi:hypothetical protein